VTLSEILTFIVNFIGLRAKIIRKNKDICGVKKPSSLNLEEVEPNII
jgi:hypothetical protein